MDQLVLSSMNEVLGTKKQQFVLAEFELMPNQQSKNHMTVSKTFNNFILILLNMINETSKPLREFSMKMCICTFRVGTTASQFSEIYQPH